MLRWNKPVPRRPDRARLGTRSLARRRQLELLAELLPWEQNLVRPWGHAETSQSRDGFRLKRLTVAPGKTFTVEIRGTRSTVRVVVHGLVKIDRGSERLLLAEGESTCPPSGVQHRLTNAGEDAVEIIEVQTESRLSEKGAAGVVERHPPA
ncbi:MAG: cupin domain-containing protein [Pseudomonadales bacterium]|nr:cupin domain-containing protein [Pseudomonadales bacterium]